MGEWIECNPLELASEQRKLKAWMDNERRRLNLAPVIEAQNGWTHVSQLTASQYRIIVNERGAVTEEWYQFNAGEVVTP
jgi:hypothetical protein